MGPAYEHPEWAVALLPELTRAGAARGSDTSDAAPTGTARTGIDPADRLAGRLLHHTGPPGPQASTPFWTPSDADALI